MRSALVSIIFGKWPHEFVCLGNPCYLYGRKLMELLSTTIGDQFSNRIGKIEKLKISLRVIGKQYKIIFTWSTSLPQ